MGIWNSFCNKINEQNIICYGAGNNANRMLNSLYMSPFIEKIQFFVDADNNKIGKTIGNGKFEFEIRNIDALNEIDKEAIIVNTLTDFTHVSNMLVDKGFASFNWVELEIDRAIETIQNNCTEKERFFIFNTPDYANLGDHAIVEGEREFLRRFQRDIYEIPTSLCGEREITRLKQIINSKDIIFIQGGGNMGSLWRTCEYNIRRVISNFRENRVIIFPQSICYEDNEDADRLLQESIVTYNNHYNLTVCARDQMTYDFIGNTYRCKRLLVPDMVLNLSYFNNTIMREGISILLRNDKERRLSMEDSNSLRLIIKETNEKNTDISHHSNYSEMDRKSRLSKVLSQYQSSKVVVTDRLHGMIFSFVTGTPCIAFDNSYGKLHSFYNTWFRDCDYIMLYEQYYPEEFRSLLRQYVEMSSDSRLFIDLRNSFEPLIKHIERELNYVSD